MAATPIKGLFEAHLTVSDLDRSITFHREIVGLTMTHNVPERHAAFFWVGAPGGVLIGLWSVHFSPMRMRLHLAFTVTLENVIASVATLRGAGIVPRGDGGSPPVEEPVVIS